MKKFLLCIMLILGMLVNTPARALCPSPNGSTYTPYPAGVANYPVMSPGAAAPGGWPAFRGGSENSYYTAGLWTNGDVVVKRQIDDGVTCPYDEFDRVRLKLPDGTRLAGATERLPTDAGSDLPSGSHTVTFYVFNDANGYVHMQVYVDNVAQFLGDIVDTTGNRIPDGAAGLRTDWVDTQVDNIYWQ